jgi:hypothetical protein
MDDFAAMHDARLPAYHNVHSLAFSPGRLWPLEPRVIGMPTVAINLFRRRVKRRILLERRFR